jgi:hypothetical protein
MTHGYPDYEAITARAFAATVIGIIAAAILIAWLIQ